MTNHNTPIQLGPEVFVEESNEVWSTFRLEDGTVLLGKVQISSARRVLNQFDAAGKPLYSVNGGINYLVKAFPKEFEPTRN